MPKERGKTPAGLSEFMSPRAMRLLTAGGSEFVRQIGIEVVRGVVLDVLTGRNLRDSTEILTRRRIAALNLATVSLFLRGASKSSDFADRLPHLATEILKRKRLERSERWLAQWVLGLTDKAFQNVLRDNPKALADYRDRYIATCAEAIDSHAAEYGNLAGTLTTSSGLKAEINWLFMTYLLNAVGSATLAIRGSDKSAYGKLFEKLVLGSLLHMLGFEHVAAEDATKLSRVFWLSSREQKRESDATLLYEAGKGVRFDIGFIGRGNPEISLDKVTRFEREIARGSSRWYLATFIIVDRIGPGSRIERLAKKVGGRIIQMSAAYWPQQVARELHRAVGFKHELLRMKAAEVDAFLKRKMKEVPLQEFIGPAEE